MNRSSTLKHSMSKMIAGLAILVFFALSSAQPKVQVDSMDIDIGSIKEGAQEEIRYSFKLKNIGNEPLVIKKVKPG